jgi:hypothetical protein
LTTLSRAFRKPDTPVRIDGNPSLLADIQRRLGLTDDEIAVGNYLPLLVRALTLHADAGLGLARETHYLGAAYQFALGLQAAEMIASPPPPGSALAAAFERDRLLGRRELAQLAEADKPIARSAILAFGGRLTPSLLGDAQRILETGVRLFPRDAELALALGAVHESLARPESQRDIESRKAQARLQSDLEKQPGSFSRRMNEGERRLASMNRRAELAAAARLFGQALAGASSRDEASLRLGHVMMEQGKAGDAVPLLEAASVSRDTFVPYNGLLLLTRVNADAGRPREAARCFRLAATVFPGAQAPITGLSLLDDDAGQTDVARLRALAASTRAGGATTLHDAVYAGLVTARAGGGRRLLIVFSDGADTASWLRDTDVLRVARRSDVLTCTVAAGGGNTPPFLAELARATGGTVLEAAGDTDLRNAFLKVLREFRNRYLLFYTPRGGARAGWHAIDVRVRRHAYTIQARPGYMIDASAGGSIN